MDGRGEASINRRNELVANRIGDRFHAAGNLQFGEDIANMKFNSGTADDQAFGDLAVVEALNHQHQYFALALG